MDLVPLAKLTIVALSGMFSGIKVQCLRALSYCNEQTIGTSMTPDEAPSAHLPVAPGPMVPWAMAPLSPILTSATKGPLGGAVGCVCTPGGSRVDPYRDWSIRGGPC